jgi:hypothetical protein
MKKEAAVMGVSLKRELTIMQFHNHVHKNQIGASLMELVVGMGLIGVISLAGAQVSKQTSSATLATRLQENFNGLATTLSERVRYPDTCAIAMGLNPSIPYTLNPLDYANSVQEIPLSVPNMRAGAGMNSDIVQTNTPIIPLGLNVERLWLSNPVDVTDPTVPIPPAPLPPPNKSIVTLLWLQVTGLNTEFSFRTKLLGTMILDVDPANQIVGCRTDQVTSYREMCEKIGCVYDDTLPVPCDCPDKPISACPSWQLPVGVTPDGELNCQQWAGLCGPGELFVGGRLSANAAAPGGSPYCMPDPLWEPPVQLPGSNVSFAVASSTGLEGMTHNILINLPSVQTSPVSVTFSILGGTASRPADYNYPSPTVVIPVGSTTGTIAVSIVDDGVTDPGETAIFRLMSVFGGGPPPLTIGGITDHTLTIAEAGVICNFAGTSTTGAGGPAAPAGCNCNVAGDVWDPGTSTCGAAPPPPPPPGPPPGCPVWNPITFACLESTCPAAGTPCAPAPWFNIIVDDCGCVNPHPDPTASRKWSCDASGTVVHSVVSPGGC